MVVSADVDNRVVMGLIMGYYLLLGWGGFHRGGNFAVLEPGN